MEENLAKCADAIRGMGWEFISLPEKQALELSDNIEPLKVAQAIQESGIPDTAWWVLFQEAFHKATVEPPENPTVSVEPLLEAPDKLYTAVTPKEAAYIFSRYISYYLPPASFEVMCQGWVEHLAKTPRTAKTEA